ncbi:helix-turn-helix domain-containing protein [Variovorax terrae]|uniref:Histidine kinase n=1 Tax=Variovorax terrae TaxID=2923278 RepID=A0A9X1VUH0_9BURK|nr:helix-turn-helix domain-containing protein [Variovorax terrae]MCJ0764081.1 histidine kinase [Variovorax terrae]
MKPVPTAFAEQRLQQIEQARETVMQEGRSLTDTLVDAWFERSWIERSWRRCLAQGQRPEQHVAFDVIPAEAMRRTREASHSLVQAAKPVLDRLGRAIASTRYFAILTDAEGTVIDVGGPVDHSDRRAQAIARIGVDLSERSIGTSAISAALTELRPVWLHRGEHFFADTAVYSCAGAPLFGPDGHCVGMLDLTGIEAAERPELQHLVMQSARSIENALTLSRPHSLLVRLNWPGHLLGDEADGLVCLNADGWVTGANQMARQMIAQLVAGTAPLHCSELFAAPHELLFDTARRHGGGAPPPLELPLWSGLRLQALPLRPGQAAPLPRTPPPATADSLPLKDVEIALIRKAVDDARGNVMKAARALGISRATVYRKLGRQPPR